MEQIDSRSLICLAQLISAVTPAQVCIPLSSSSGALLFLQVLLDPLSLLYVCLSCHTLTLLQHFPLPTNLTCGAAVYLHRTKNTSSTSTPVAVQSMGRGSGWWRAVGSPRGWTPAVPGPDSNAHLALGCSLNAKPLWQASTKTRRSHLRPHICEFRRSTEHEQKTSGSSA